MKHVELIIAEIRHGKGADTTCTCRSSEIDELIREMAKSIGITQTRVALSIATGDVFPREMSCDGELLNRTCRPVSRQRLAKVLEDMVKECLTLDTK